MFSYPGAAAASVIFLFQEICHWCEQDHRVLQALLNLWHKVENGQRKVYYHREIEVILWLIGILFAWYTQITVALISFLLVSYNCNPTLSCYSPYMRPEKIINFTRTVGLSVTCCLLAAYCSYILHPTQRFPIQPNPIHPLIAYASTSVSDGVISSLFSLSCSLFLYFSLYFSLFFSLFVSPFHSFSLFSLYLSLFSSLFLFLSPSFSLLFSIIYEIHDIYPWYLRDSWYHGS